MYSCSHFRSFLSKVRERIVIGALSKRGQETTSNDGSPTAKARPVNLAMRSQYNEAASSLSLGSRVNPGNDDERKRVGQAPTNCEVGNSKSEVARFSSESTREGSSSRQEIKSKEIPSGTRKLAACSPEFRIMEHTNHRCMGKIFQVLEKKLGMSAINATFSMDSHKTNVLTWGLFLARQ